MDQQLTNASQEDPLAMLMSQLQAMSLDVVTSTNHNHSNKNPESDNIDQVLQEQTSIHFQLEWDDYVQRVQHATLLKAQIEGQRPLLGLSEFKKMVLQYASTSFNIQRPAFLQEYTIAGMRWIDANPGADGWELIHSNRLRQMDDLILIREILEAEGTPCPLSREDLVRWREHALELRNQQRDFDRRHRLLVEERRLFVEEHRFFEENRRQRDERELRNKEMDQ